MGAAVLAALLALGTQVTVGQRTYEVTVRPTTAHDPSESGNNRHLMTGAHRDMVTVTLDGQLVHQFVCIDECQRWSGTQLVQRALTLRTRRAK